MPTAHASVMFYRSTRPQAPKYAKAPELADKVECSVCRTLFLDDTKEAKAAHRAWHKQYGNVGMPCADAATVGLLYTRLWTCGACSEDVCPCPDCTTRHRAIECDQYKKAWDLHAAGDEDGCEEIMNEILAARPDDLPANL